VRTTSTTLPAATIKEASRTARTIMEGRKRRTMILGDCTKMSNRRRKRTSTRRRKMNKQSNKTRKKEKGKNKGMAQNKANMQMNFRKRMTTKWM
jgi:hypothetical protein